MIDNVRTGQNIAAFRQRLGWTQGELANRLNVTHQAVSKWENGAAFPDISTLYALSQLFGVSMEILLTGEPAAPENALVPPVQPEFPQPTESPCEAVGPVFENPASSIPPAPETAAYDWNEIIALAPFASRETLDRLIGQCEDACDREHISALAPFISRQTLDRLIRNGADCADWDYVVELAPFASRETLDYLVTQCEAACDRERIHALAPFISRQTLDRLIRKGADCADWDYVVELAPFASRETLDYLVAQCESSCDRERIHALAPFLGRDTLDRLILSSIGLNTSEKNAPCPEEHWEDRLAAWSEAQERQMERSAHMAEALEAQTEKAMRRAERVAERQMERAARRAERIAEKQLERMARHTVHSASTPLTPPEKHPEQDASDRPAHAIRPSDERRTEIIDVAPACSTLDEYADQIISLLCEACDAAEPVVARLDEIRCALLNQDLAALNEFAPLLDEHIGPEWLEKYASLCPDAEIPPDFEQQIDLALAQCNWNWIEDHAHLITDPEIIRRIVLASASAGFFDFVPLFADQLDQGTIDAAARQAVLMNRTDDILSIAGRISPGILD